MILALALMGCARPPPPGPPPPPALTAPAPDPPAGLDGWHLLQSDGRWWWADLSGRDVEPLLAEATPRPSPTAPPDAPDVERTRRFLATLDAVARPTAWTWPDAEGSLGPHAPELVAVEPVRHADGTLAVRAWLRPLDAAPPALALTDWSRDGSPPHGAPASVLPGPCADRGLEPVPLATRRHGTPVPDAVPRCAVLELEEGALLTTSWPVHTTDRAPEAPADAHCTTGALRFPHGGVRWVAPACSEHPLLPIAWLRSPEGRLVVLEEADPTTGARCLARIPAADQPFEPRGCVPGAPGTSAE